MPNVRAWLQEFRGLEIPDLEPDGELVEYDEEADDQEFNMAAYERNITKIREHVLKLIQEHPESVIVEDAEMEGLR